MLDFFLFPILSLFSVKFYQRVLSSSLTQGFLYLAYLSFLFSLWGLFMFTTVSLPVADELAQWVGKNLPPLVLTKQGVRMAINEPLLLTHPRWGELIYLDPTLDSPKAEDLEKAVIVITRKKAAYRNPSNGEYRMQDLTPRKTGKEWRDFTITGDRVLAFWVRVKPILFLIFFIVAFLGVYLWKLAAGLSYSLVGLVLNRFRKERLSYGSLLNVTFFALTPATLLQTLGRMVHLRIPVNFFVALLITSLYLTLGIIGTQNRNPQSA